MAYKIHLELTEEQALALGNMLSRELYGSIGTLDDAYSDLLSSVDDLLAQATASAEKA